MNGFAERLTDFAADAELLIAKATPEDIWRALGMETLPDEERMAAIEPLLAQKMIPEAWAKILRGT